MGLQPHQFNGFRESKRRTQFDYAGLQHQTCDEYSGSSDINCEIEELEVALQSEGVFCF
jgi:hypothetical protein